MGTDFLFKRDCVKCPSQPPSCSGCSHNEICSLSVQTCEKCPEARCISQSTTGVSSKAAGAIAGGVVGGLVGIGIIVGIIFWYKFRGRRSRHLEDMRDVLEYESPPDSPELNPYQEEFQDEEEDFENKLESMSTRAPSSNRIPILFTGPTGNMSRNMSLNRDIRPGLPTIRDSIHDSEYSVESEYFAGANNQALRHFDVAVQGHATIVHANKPQRPESGRQMLGIINESDDGETSSVRSSQNSRRYNHSMNRNSPSMQRMKRHGSNAMLPQVPSVRSSMVSNRRTLNPPASNPRNADDNASIASPFADPSDATNAHPTLHDATPTNQDNESSQKPMNMNSRYSKASSTEYVADLPEEARLYTNY